MKKEFIDVINKLANKGKELGFYHLNMENESFDGKHLTVKGKEYIYFSSCSYMGLETNEKMKLAAIDAVQRYGTQFSSSRTSISLTLYEELEDLLGKIYGKPTYLAPTTSLGHISIIPTIMDTRDAIIMDQQVHNSVKNAVQMVKGDGVYTEILKHNKIDYLETRIQILKQSYDRVWYMCDSVYSIFGDTAPFKDITPLLDRYEQFHLYVDDAHGMSWAGKHGRGYVLNQMPFHEHMIVTSSLAKGFGSCGGALIFNDEAQKELIRNCSSSSIFSGPLQPAVLGASIASAKIHLSNEIETMQDELFERMFYFVQTAANHNIPIINNEMTPIFYVAIGKPEVGQKLSLFLQNEGYFSNYMVFPTVPMKNSGMRITLTRHHSLQDIQKLLERVAYGFEKIMKEENYSMEELYEDFSMIDPSKSNKVEPVIRLKVA